MGNGDRHVKAWGWFRIRMEGCHYVALCGRAELLTCIYHKTINRRHEISLHDGGEIGHAACVDGSRQFNMLQG